MESIPFYTGYLNSNLRLNLIRLSKKQKVQLYPTFSLDIYSEMALRLESVFLRIGQYPNGFIKRLVTYSSVGYLIYVSEKDEMKNFDKKMLPLLKKKSKLTSEILESEISKGLIVLYFGNLEFVDYECYITRKRLSELSKDKNDTDFFKKITIYDFNILMAKTVTSMLFNRIVKVNNTSLLMKYPQFISSFESSIVGINMFNLDGFLDLGNNLAFKIVGREYAVRSFYSLNKISVLSQLTNIDSFHILPEYLLNEEQVTLQNELRSFSSSEKSGMVEILITLKREVFRLFTFLNISSPINIYSKEQNIKERIMSIISFMSYGAVRTKFEISYKNVKSIVPIRLCDKLPTDRLLVSALQLRKSFINDREMNIAVISRKGSGKTAFKNMINDLNLPIVIIDSDLYGNWVSFKKYGMMTNERKFNYFSVLANQIIMRKNKKITDVKLQLGMIGEQMVQFNYEFAKIVSNEEYGIGNYQNYLYNEYKDANLILFLHTTVEANMLSGKWVQIVINSIFDENESLLKREDYRIENFLSCVYNSMIATTTRMVLNWADLILILTQFSKGLINMIEQKLSDLNSITQTEETNTTTDYESLVNSQV